MFVTVWVKDFWERLFALSHWGRSQRREVGILGDDMKRLLDALLILHAHVYEVYAQSLGNTHLANCLTSHQKERRCAMVVRLGVTAEWVRVGYDTLVDMVVMDKKRSSTDIE